uniref:Protein P n=1 Tax=Alewife hepatitis B virus TaxID=3066367 RepID=A0AA49X708_9HEPA|nr:polymerase [Alewife hepatitis B virus]
MLPFFLKWPSPPKTTLDQGLVPVLQHLCEEHRHGPHPLSGVSDYSYRASSELGTLRGLYQNINSVYNQDWIVPEFQNIHVSETIKVALPSRRWKLLFPARLFVPSARYYSHDRAIKNKYPENQVHHEAKVIIYFWRLLQGGVIYIRHSSRHWRFIGTPYSWESCVQHITDCNNVRDICESGWRSPSCQACQAGRCEDGDDRGGGPVTDGLGESGMVPSTTPGATPSGDPKRDQTLRPGVRLPEPPSLHPMALGGCHSSDERGRVGSPEGDGRTNSSPRASPTQTQSTLPPSTQSQRSVGGLTTSKDGTCTTRDSSPCCAAHFTKCNSHTSGRQAQNHGQHIISAGSRIPSRNTGGCFLVDKNPRNIREARLVVDFSQFSRLPARVSWSKYASPNLRALAQLLPPGMSWVSLDISAAFYHIPIHPGAATRLLCGIPRLTRQHTDLLWTMLGRVELRRLLVQLYRLKWSDLQMLLCSGRPGHQLTLGFRKAPMGVGLSPFLLAQFTAIICQHIRRTFNGCVCFAYMDDIVLGHPSDHHLATVHHAVCSLLVAFGIKINPDKTRWSGTTLFFLGLEFREQGWTPAADKLVRVQDLLGAIVPGQFYDPKVLQRLIGTLAFMAPFTRFGYAILRPLYQAVLQWKDFAFSQIYVDLLCMNARDVFPVQRIELTYPLVFSDATTTTVAYVDYVTGAVEAHNVAEMPIFLAELVALLWAAIQTQALHIGVDNSAVIARKHSRLPFALGCIASAVLHYVHLHYVPSALNPADYPSRGHFFLPPYPRGLVLTKPSLSHVSLTVFPHPVIPHRASSVAFCASASPEA